MADDWSVHIVGETLSYEVYSPGLQVIEGDLSESFGAIIEKLQTPGVDSYRYRLKGRESHDLRLLLNEDMVGTRIIYDDESIYMAAEAELCTLTVSILGAQIRWKHVTVEQVQIVGRTGPLYGRGAKSGSKHTIWTQWLFHRQKEGEILG